MNTERAAIMVLDEFRGGVIGRITLEAPGQQYAPREPKLEETEQ